MVVRGLIIFLALVASLLNATAREGLGWVQYTNERFGFSFRYPAELFRSERRSETGDGEVLIGADDRGRLLVGAFENAEHHSVASYMQVVRTKSYSTYDVTYSRRGENWFVLSGRNNQNVFYEKVMLSCGGGIISSFALVYPIENKWRFDPVVEGIENTFRPGQDCRRHATR